MELKMKTIRSVKQFNYFYYRICEKIAKEISTCLPKKENKIVIDIGCGDGALTVPLAKYLKKWRVIGIDSNKTALNILTKKIEENRLRNVDIIHVNALQLSEKVKIKVDCIVSHWFLSCITRLDSLFRLIEEFNAVLKRNGVMFHYEIFPQQSNISQLLFREADRYVLRAKWWDIDTLVTILKYKNFKKIRAGVIPIKFKILPKASMRLFFEWENEYKKNPIKFEESRTKKFFERWNKEVSSANGLEILNEYFICAVK
jgi:ubiquinone/menaquinone biosynthesis C-methylase UbiE